MKNENNKNLGKNAITLTTSKVLTMIIGLLTSMMLSRFRTLEEYGTYSQLLMCVNLVTTLFMLGLPNSLNYFIVRAENNDDKNKFLSVYYTLSSILSVIIGVVLILSIPIIEKFYKNKMIHLFWYFLAFYPWTQVIKNSIENLMVVYNKTNILIIFKFLNSLIILLIIILVQLIKGSFMIYMICFIGVEIVFTCIVYIIIKWINNDFKFKLDKGIILSIFKFSIPIGLASMIGTINIELDKLIISTFYSVEDLAIYVNASKELPVTIISASLTAILMPQIVQLLSEKKLEKSVLLWNSGTKLAFIIICIISLGCFFFAPEVITILYSEKYLPGVSVFRIYCIELLMRCTYFGMLLNSTGNTRFVLYSSLISVILNFILNIAFYYIFGFIGPAIATLIVSIIMNISQLAFTCKILNFKFTKIFPWLKCLLILITNSIIGLIMFFIKEELCLKFIKYDIIISISLGIIWVILSLLIFKKEIKKNWNYLNKC